MNVTHAIEAHSKWKITLRSAINTGQLPAKTPSDSGGCELGKWLATEAKPPPELVRAHQAFHATAGKVWDLVKAGKKQEASRLLDTEFTQASLKVVTQLTQLNKQPH